MITFGGLGLLGQWLGAGGTGAAAVAAVVAVAAAIGEARGVRIVPQVRRQVPESWRRVLPVPLAAGLYGVLLGLGFTTFILTFAVWALAAVSVALGDPQLGAVLGLAFGAGRALPVIALAPVAETDRGNAAHAAMAERPAILRGLRAADAVALAACARGDDRSGARARGNGRRRLRGAAPSAAASLFAFQRPGGVGYLRRADGTVGLPGRDPALGAGLVGWRDAQSRIVLATHRHAHARRELRRAGRRPVRVQRPLGRVAGRRQAALRPAARLERRAARGRPRARGRAARPPVDRRRHRRLPPRRQATAPQIRLLDLATGRDTLLRSEHRALLSNPTFDGRRLLYVRSTYTRQELRLGALRRARDDQGPAALPTHPDRPPRPRARAGPPPPLRRLPATTSRRGSAPARPRA